MNLRTLLLSAVFSLFFHFNAGSQALNFDGTNDYVVIDSVANDFTGLTNFTVEFWMKADKNAQSSVRVGMFAVNAPSSSGDNVFIITMGGMNLQDGKLLIVDNVTGFDFVSSTVIGDNTCHHIAYVRNGSVSTMYIDGVVAGTHVPDYSFVASDRYSLGQEWDILNPSDMYEGSLDEVRLWNVARTANEILTYKNQELTGTESGLIAYYRCNQGVPNGNNPGITSLNDVSGNSNNGTLTNFALSGSVSNWSVACESNISGVGIHSLYAVNDWSIYPNPASDVLTVYASFTNPVQFDILNVHGQTVQTIFLTGVNPTINVGELTGGMYFLRSEEFNCKFIKQ